MTEEEHKEAKRLADIHKLHTAPVLQTDYHQLKHAESFVAGYAAACEAKRNELNHEKIRSGALLAVLYVIREYVSVSAGDLAKDAIKEYEAST